MKDLAAGITSSSTFTGSLPTAGNAAYGGAAPTSNFSQLVHDILLPVFSLLGVIFLCLTIYAGFLWMTAAGDPKKVQKAKDILAQSVTGIVLVMLAYGITYFVTGWLVVIRY